MKFKWLVLFCILIYISLVSAESNINYHIWLKYDRGVLSMKSVNVELIQYEFENFFNEDFDSYKIKILDSKGDILYEDKFSVINIQIYDILDEEEHITEGGIIELDELEFDMYLPYYENAKEIVIYDLKDNEINKELVSHYSKTGFNKKDFAEGVVDSEAVGTEIEDIEKKEHIEIESDNGWKILLWGLVILIIIGLVVYLKKYKKRKR